VKVVSGFEEFQVDRGIHKPGFLLEAFDCKFAVLGIKLNADAVPATFHGCSHCSAAPAKRINDRVAPEREHPDEAVGEFQGEWGWMDFG
jgi:hypothetical protein